MGECKIIMCKKNSADTYIWNMTFLYTSKTYFIYSGFSHGQKINRFDHQFQKGNLLRILDYLRHGEGIPMSCWPFKTPLIRGKFFSFYNFNRFPFDSLWFLSPNKISREEHPISRSTTLGFYNPNIKMNLSWEVLSLRILIILGYVQKILLKIH